MPGKSKKWISRKLAIGLAALSALVIEAVLDAVLGLPHATTFIQATVVVSGGGVATQGALDMLGTGPARMAANELIKRLSSKPVTTPPD